MTLSVRRVDVTRSLRKVFRRLAAGSILACAVDASAYTGPWVHEVGRWQPERGDTIAVALAGSILVSNEGRYLKTFTATDPDSPILIGSYAMDCEIQDVAVAGDVAFVACSGKGLIAVSIADPIHPQQIDAFVNAIGYDCVVAQGSRVFAESASAIQIFDVSSLAAPLGTILNVGYGRFAVAGNYLYLPLGTVEVFDVSNPAAPAMVGEWNPEGQGAPAVFAAVAVSGATLVTVGADGMAAFDISDPATPKNPRFSYSLTAGSNVRASDGFAYVTDAAFGVKVFDLANPLGPALVATFDSPGHAHDVAVSGDVIWIADTERGLRKTQRTDRPAPSVIGSVSGQAMCVAVDQGLAFLGLGSGGFNVVDISDPTAPRWISSYVGNPSQAEAIAVQGGVAYLAAYPGLQVVDVSTPTSPQALATIPIVNGIRALLATPGRLYAGGDLGLEVFDISVPATPVLLGSYPGLSAYSLALEGSRLYVGSYQSLVILDVSDPTLPSPLGAFPTSSSATGVAVTGARALVLDGDQRDLWALDVTDPALPAVVGRLTLPPRVPYDYMSRLHVTGSQAWVLDYKGDLRVVDVSDPAAMVEVGEFSPSQVVDVASQGNLAFFAGPDGLSIADLSHLMKVSEVGSYYTPGRALGVAARGNSVFLADDDAGLRVFDVSDTSTPRLVGVVDTPGSAQAVALADHLALVADGPGGLRVIDIADLASPGEVGHVTFSQDVVAVAASPGMAYAVRSDGLSIVDVSDPSSPTVVGEYPTSTERSLAVAVTGGVACLLTSGGLRVLDVSDSHTPRLVGSWDQPPQGLHIGIAFDGATAWIPDGMDRLYVVDVSDPTAPRTISSFGTQVHYTTRIALDHRTAFALATGAGFNVEVLDARNPAHPTAISWFSEARFTDLAADGERIFLASERDGLWIYAMNDADRDLVPDYYDNCLTVPNSDQADFDNDGIGDACEVGAWLADADNSGRVDGFDLLRLALAFGSRDGDANYDPRADFDRDGDVDGDDVALFAPVFGQTVP